MLRVSVLALLTVGSCGDPASLSLPPPQAFDRTEAGVVPPDCSLGATCPDAVAGLDPAFCIADAAPFVVEIDDLSGAILDAHTDEAAIAALHLAEGRWWTVFADPNGSCDGALTVIVSVEVPDPLE